MTDQHGHDHEVFGWSRRWFLIFEKSHDWSPDGHDQVKEKNSKSFKTLILIVFNDCWMVMVTVMEIWGFEKLVTVMVF